MATWRVWKNYRDSKPRLSQSHRLRVTLTVGITTHMFHVKGHPSCCINGTSSDLGHLDDSSLLSPPLTPVPTLFPSLPPWDQSPHHCFLSYLPGTIHSTFSSPSWGLLRANCTSFPLQVFSLPVYSEYTYHISLCKTPLSSAHMHKRASLLFVSWTSPSSSAGCGSWSASCWPDPG